MKKSFLKQAHFLFAVAMLFSSCATIIDGSNYPVSIRTNPPGADVTITNKFGEEIYKGQSPANITLKSGAGYFSRAMYKVKLSSPGFKEKVIEINFRFNGWYIGNIVLGGAIGWLIVDPLTGGMWKISNAEQTVDETLFRNNTGASLSTSPNLNIVDIKDVPNDMKGKLVRVN